MDEAETEEDQGESERDEELRNDWSRSSMGSMLLSLWG